MRIWHNELHKIKVTGISSINRCKINYFKLWILFPFPFLRRTGTQTISSIINDNKKSEARNIEVFHIFQLFFFDFVLEQSKNIYRWIISNDTQLFQFNKLQIDRWIFISLTYLEKWRTICFNHVYRREYKHSSNNEREKEAQKNKDEVTNRQESVNKMETSYMWNIYSPWLNDFKI